MEMEIGKRKVFPKTIFGVPVKYDPTLQPDELRWNEDGIRANPMIGLHISLGVVGFEARRCKARGPSRSLDPESGRCEHQEGHKGSHSHSDGINTLAWATGMNVKAGE